MTIFLRYIFCGLLGASANVRTRRTGSDVVEPSRLQCLCKAFLVKSCWLGNNTFIEESMKLTISDLLEN